MSETASEKMARLKREQIARNKAGKSTGPKRGQTDLQKRSARKSRDKARDARGAEAVSKANASLDRNKREIEAGPAKARDALNRRMRDAGVNQNTDSNN